MINIKCIGKIRNKNNVISGYALQDASGNQMDVNAKALKEAIKSGKVNCINLKLTRDGKLVDKTPIEDLKKSEVKEIKDTPNAKIHRVKGMNTPPCMYGIAIKGIKTLIGREGEYYCGSVYKNGKKLGDWSQSPYGAITDDFFFDEAELDDAVLQWSKETQYGGRLDKESFMLALVILTEYFGIYKRALKNGRNCLVIITDEYDMSYRALQCSIPNKYSGLPSDVNILINRYKTDILKSGYNPVVKVFKSFDDFEIG